MSDAPEKIYLWSQPDGMFPSWHLAPHPMLKIYGNHEYIRADIAHAQLAQAREHAADLRTQLKNMESSWNAASSAYNAEVDVNIEAGKTIEQLRERLAARNGFKASTEAEGDAYAFGFMDGIDEANSAAAEDGQYVYGIGDRLFVTGSKAAIRALSIKLGRAIKPPKAEPDHV